MGAVEDSGFVAERGDTSLVFLRGMFIYVYRGVVLAVAW